MKRIIDLLKEIRPEFDFTASKDFLEDGYLDSFDLVTLVAAMDKEYGIKIKGVDVVPENFCSLETIRHLAAKYGVTDEI